MKTKLLKMARRIWNNDMVPKELNRKNQVKWAKAVAALGDKWVVIKQIERKTHASV